jgi:putative membrane protein
MKKLEGLSGDVFDRAYSSHMVSDQEKDVAESEKQSKNGKNSDLKVFASKTLPTLQEHLKLARSLPGAATASRK